MDVRTVVDRLRGGCEARAGVVDAVLARRRQLWDVRDEEERRSQSAHRVGHTPQELHLGVDEGCAWHAQLGRDDGDDVPRLHVLLEEAEVLLHQLRGVGVVVSIEQPRAVHLTSVAEIGPRTIEATTPEGRSPGHIHRTLETGAEAGHHGSGVRVAEQEEHVRGAALTARWRQVPRREAARSQAEVVGEAPRAIHAVLQPRQLGEPSAILVDKARRGRARLIGPEGLYARHWRRTLRRALAVALRDVRSTRAVDVTATHGVTPDDALTLGLAGARKRGRDHEGIARGVHLSFCGDAGAQRVQRGFVRCAWGRRRAH